MSKSLCRYNLTVTKGRTLQMQEVDEDCGMDDDVVDGDLGFGMGVRAAAAPTRRKAHSFVGVADGSLSRAQRFRNNSQTPESPWCPGARTTETQARAQWRLPQSGRSYSTHTHTHTCPPPAMKDFPGHADSLLELSKDELRTRLQEASEVKRLISVRRPPAGSRWCFCSVAKVIDVLLSELEVAHRYLEGKYEALKILQGKVS